MNYRGKTREMSCTWNRLSDSKETKREIGKLMDKELSCNIQGKIKRKS